MSWACEQWLAVLEADSTKTTLSVTNYLKKCLTSGVAKGYIKYTSWDGNARQTFPQVITLAGVLTAVVLDDSVLSPKEATLLRDIATEWKDWSVLSATQHMFEYYASQTTGMSKTDPGWDTSDISQITDAKITHGAAIFIFDFVVKQKLFNFSCFLGVNRSSQVHPYRVHGREQSVAEARHRVRLRQHGVFCWLHLRG